jgi:hypothetical protein
MPYIIMKRSDIPAGTLQVLDLDPNVSQRNQTLDPPGQTKYVNPVVNDAIVTTQPGGAGTPTLIHREAYGLAAYIVTNVNDGTGAVATGDITIAAGNVAAANSVQINASAVGGPNLTFTFTAGAPVAATDVQVGGTNLISTTNLVARINLPANGYAPYLVATDAGAGVTLLTATNEGTAANAIAMIDVGANITADATFAGGVDANALTAADANDMAAAILDDMLLFGDLTGPAVAMDLAAVNAVLGAVVATAAITADQLSEVLDILAGRVYYCPKGVQIDADDTTFEVLPAVGTATGPHFVAGTLRDIFDTDSLTISVAAGELAGFLSSDFVYRATPGNPNGEAVVVLNDDGTIFVP